MRALAEKLGVTPMAMYHHVTDRGHLVSLIADAVLAGVTLPSTDRWQDWMVEYQSALFVALGDIDGLAAHLLAHPSTPAGAAARRATVAVLRKAGFDERGALLGASTFHTHLLGRLAVATLRDPGREDEPDWHQTGLGAEDYLLHGIATLIAGLEAQL
jgi:AcrR family transcriptional regulator